MHELGGSGMEVSCGVWWIDGTALGNGGGFFPSDKGMYQRRRAIHRSWDGRVFFRGCCMVDREFTETVDTAE